MNKLFITLIMLVVSNSNAITITFANKTGTQMRITKLGNKCDGLLITEDKAVIIPYMTSKEFKTKTPVVHTFEVCANGFCASSAMGMNGTTNSYTSTVTLDSNGMPDIKQNPDHWVGNIECPKGK